MNMYLLLLYKYLGIKQPKPMVSISLTFQEPANWFCKVLAPFCYFHQQYWRVLLPPHSWSSFNFSHSVK